MVTVANYGERRLLQDGSVAVQFDFRGSSADEMPTEYDGVKVDNGSTYLCVDAGHAGELFTFDFTEHIWNEVK